MAEHEKLVWIIGASSGIGASLAQLYARSGWQVAVSARNEQKLQAVAQDASSVDVMPLDVTDAVQVSEALERFQQTSKLPDLTVYCSGVYFPGGIDVLSEEHSVASMDTNYFGAVRVIAGLFPLLKQQGAGHIAIVSSLSGYCGLPNAACYGPTKAALINLCESLKSDFDKAGIDLSLVNPGFVKTPMTDKNTFEMPFLLGPEQAANDIYRGLEKRKFEIYFPFRLAAIMKILRLLPYALYFPVTRRMSKR
ncbi:MULTISPECIES: SDR family NAD(P)-dependent oxidoreductase [unclassified Pseudovibrio]|uniref:SDR family NAD(P)-dependent oxidoreductase n=1 Tax=unclassified Pseudovibrio TaxID=2627060 RepID=UPI0007AE8885|nr:MULTISPECIES: SDR family NAD(P)-dependent oxidoreductase [unclassified Pseudovibrio]KZL03065.1 putative oxidoreductase [Pseudovibrio sp. W74]KZL04916.1 putative oxidoreductase [Pseudovibrio sp. Ad14]